MSEEIRRRAVLRAGAGDDVASIAADLGADPTTVEEWLSRPAAHDVSLRYTSIELSKAMLEDALSERPWAHIERSDDPGQPTDGLVIEFDDFIAHAAPAIIDSVVERLRNYPGVAGPYREDREIVIASDDGVDRATCESDINDWIAAELLALAAHL